MQTLTTSLLFSGKAEEAVNFYVSTFENAAIHKINRYGEGFSFPAGTVMAVSFQISGQEFMAINGPEVQFTQATSFQINCDTQEEIDTLWERLSEGGNEIGCGWVTDRFGVTWQINPRILEQLGDEKNGVKADRVMKALCDMKKLDIAKLQQAFDGE